MKNRVSALLLLICTLSLMVGCYRMPQENEYSLIPTTNNRDVTYEKSDSLMPGVKY